MKNIYIKTTWVDNKTPVNAANLNKIENAISDLYNNSLGSSDLVQGNGINILRTSDKKLEFSVSDVVIQSESCKSIEVVQEEPGVSCGNVGCMFFVIDPMTKKLKKIMYNGVVIYEVE